MNEIAQQVRTLVDQAAGEMRRISSDVVRAKRAPGKWSQQEILGHLIDSAANNHQRIVRACCGGASDFPSYAQDEWVSVQQYQLSSWMHLVDLWSLYNHHLADLIERVPDPARSSLCNVGLEDPVTLEFAVSDYFRHLRHHLGQILGTTTA